MPEHGPNRSEVLNRLEQRDEAEAGNVGRQIDEADIAGEDRRSEDVIDPLRHRDDVALDDVVAIAIHALTNDLEELAGLVSRAGLGRGKRSRGAEFISEHPGSARLVEALVVGADRSEE